MYISLTTWMVKHSLTTRKEWNMKDLIAVMFKILALCENSTVDNVAEGAIGKYQIREIYVRDVNRIAKTSYIHEDARDEKKAKEMIEIYLKHYGRRYIINTNKPLSVKVLAMIYNGGPKGYRNKSEKALDYGERAVKFYNILMKARS
jgi:hypothetical protein